MQVAGKTYDCFVNDPAGLEEGKELELVIRDLTPGRRKYEARYARVVLTSSQEPGSCELLVRSSTSGALHPKRWFAKIVEELGDYKKG